VSRKIARLVVTVVMTLFCVTVRAAAQERPVAAANDQPTQASEPSSMDRIKDALAREPALVIHLPTFRSGITERRPGYFDLAEPVALPKHPPVWNAGWHNEFLAMVTPPEFRMWQAFTNSDLLQVSATSLASGLFGKGLTSVSDWRQTAREAQAREEVDRALADFLATQSGATPEVVRR
jgi:hypothetical protein